MLKADFLDNCTYEKIESLKKIKKLLEAGESIYEKIQILDRNEEILKFFLKYPVMKTFLSGVSLNCEYVIKVYIVLGDLRLFSFYNKNYNAFERLRNFLEYLLSQENEKNSLIDRHLQIIELLKNERINNRSN